MGSVDMVENDLRIEALGVFKEAFHQLRALHAQRIGRPIVHIGCSRQLPALS